MERNTKRHAFLLVGGTTVTGPISKSELMKLEPDFAVTNAKMYRGSWDTWSLHGTRSTETWWPSPGDFHRDVRHQNAEDLNIFEWCHRAKMDFDAELWTLISCVSCTCKLMFMIFFQGSVFADGCVVSDCLHLLHLHTEVLMVHYL